MGAVTSTALDIVVGGVRNINVLEAGEAMDANDAGDALQVLNDLLDSLSTDKLFVFTANESILAWTPGQFQYSIGNPVQGTFTGYTVAGSNVITGITNPASLNITFGINASQVVVGGSLTDVQAVIAANATIVSLNSGGVFSIVFTAPPTGTSGTLTGPWGQPTGLYLITFSDGETRSGTLTSGNAAVTWNVALSGTPTASGNQVNTTTITMSLPAIATLTAADSITYTAPGNFAIPRPLRVRNGFTRITASGNTGLDYWFDAQNSIDDYNEIGYKGVPGPWPYLVAYQSTFPYGSLRVYPNPQQAGEVHFWTDVILSQFLSLTQSVNLPQGYARALKKLLAIELAPEYGKQPSPELLRQAWEARTYIKSLNETPVKKLRYDSALMNGSGKDAGWIMHGGFGSNL
jgi:hypothetical protein